MIMQDIERDPQFDYEVAQIPENRARNRFGNIFPCMYNYCMNDWLTHTCILTMCWTYLSLSYTNIHTCDIFFQMISTE